MLHMSHSRTFVAGLTLAVLLGLADLLAVTAIGSDVAPPAGIVALGGALGLITVVGAAAAWRGRRGGVATVIVSRLLSAVLGVPAFFTDGVPRVILVIVGVGIVLTVVATALLLPSSRVRPRQAVR